MKHFKFFFPILFSLFFVLIASNNKALAQLNCDISISGQTMPVCPNIDFELSAQYYDNVTYVWKQGEDIIEETENTLLISIAKATTFTLTITDNSTTDECTSLPFLVECHTPIEIEFNQLQLTCTNGDEENGNNAQIKAIASGEFEPDEYHYFWNVSYLQIDPGDSSLAVGLKAHQYYNIEVRDNYGCPAWDTVWTEAYDNPVVEITTDPDTAFIEKPIVNFSFINLSEDTVEISNHYWDYGDCFEGSTIYPMCQDDISTTQFTPTHAYTNPIYRDTTYIATLTVYNWQGCDTTYTKDVMIRLVDLFIPNVFTPNGDDFNQTFIISENPNKGGGEIDRSGHKKYDVLSKYYKSSQLVIFNRWGRVVYESNNYQNDWEGGNLPDGVYFYVLKCNGFVNNNVVYKGSVTIFGSGR